MELIDYISQRRGSASYLAEALGVSSAFVSYMASKKRKVPAPTATAIERVTGGQVTRRDLRPHDYHLIWPELATQEHAATQDESMKKT